MDRPRCQPTRRSHAMRVMVAVAIMCVAGTFALNWADTPLSTAPCGQGNMHQGNIRQENNCATCHNDSPPRTHSLEFIEAGHGPVALINRQQCVACHKQSSCDDCHQKTQPAWHTENFRRPACGWRQRDEHALVATGHRNSCSECHAKRFQDQCASCHRPDEEDLRLKFHN